MNSYEKMSALERKKEFSASHSDQVIYEPWKKVHENQYTQYKNISMYVYFL